MCHKVVSRRGRSSPVHRGAWALALFAAGTCSAQVSDERPLPQLPRLSLTVIPQIASPRPGPAGEDLGLQWRQPVGNDRTIDVLAWRRVAPRERDALSMIQDREPMFGARVEMRITSRKSFATELKAIGLQLDNGAKIMLRRKDGNPTLYYRQQF
jgi:hypothetical protein